jgi:hypothetical protein
MRRRDDRIAVLNTWVPGQHVVQFLVLEAAPSSGQVLTRCTAERVVSVVSSGRMEMLASPFDGSGCCTLATVVDAVANGSPTVFQSSVKKFISRRSVWCAQEDGASHVGRSFADYSAERQQRWYDQVIRPILVDGLFRVCTEVSSTYRLFSYDARASADGPAATAQSPEFYAQPYVGTYKTVASARILSSFVDCETPFPASVSTSVLTSYMRRFMLGLLFQGHGDAQLLTSVSCALSMSHYAVSLLEKYASSAVNDRLVVTLPALTIPSAGSQDATTRIYPRVHSSAYATTPTATTTTTDQRGAFLVVVCVGALDDIDRDASGTMMVLDVLRPRLTTVGPIPSLVWTTPESIEEGQTYALFVARVAVSRPSLYLTSETRPTWCAWSPDASGFVVSEAPSAWLQSLQVVQLAICAPAVSYYARVDASGVAVVATSSTTTGGEILQVVDVQRASFDPLTQTVRVVGPIVIYDVDMAYLRLAVWSATMDQTYLLETTPKRVNRLVNAGAIVPTLTVATLLGDVGAFISPIVLIPNLPIWVEFTFVFPGNKTCFSGPVEQLLSALVATPAGACVVPSPTDGANIRFGSPAQSPTSLLVRITLHGDYATRPPEPIQFSFQLAGSSSRIPFTLPSSSVWAFPHVRSTIIRPGVVAVGETVGFETQFDVPYGRPCPPSESWLAVDVLIAPIAALGFVTRSTLQDQAIVDASGALSAFWRTHGIGASSLTSGTWNRDASLTTTTTATLRYTYNVQEDVAHGGLMQMRLVGTRYLSPIFTWTSSGSGMLPDLDAVASPLTSSTIYTFPVSLAIESTSTVEAKVEATVGVFRALHTVDLAYVRCVGGDGLTLGAGVSRMWATFRSSTSPSAVGMVVDCSGGVVAPPSHVVDASGSSSAYVRFSRVVMASGYDSVQFSTEVRAPSAMVYRTISTPIQYVSPAPTAIRVASTVSSVHPGYVLVEGYTSVVSFTFDYGTTDPRNAFTPIARPTDYFRSLSLVDGSGQQLTVAVVTDGSGRTSLVSSAYFDATGYTVHVPICLSSLQRPTDFKCEFATYDRVAVLYSDLVSYAQIYRFPDPPRLAHVSFPSLSTSALLDASGCVMVTVGSTVRCAVALVGGSGVLPAGGSHEVRFADGSARTVRDVANDVDTNQVVTDFSLNAGASTTVFATLTLSFAGYTITYAPFPFCTPYTFPTSLVSSVQFTGTNAIAPEDSAITTLALGAVYGVDTSGSARAVCGVGNSSNVRLTLAGGDVTSVGKPTVVSAVQVVDASGVGYGTVGAFDYTRPVVTVRSYALPTDRLPVGAGVVWFRVTLTAPDATTSVVLASTGLAVRSVPNVAVPIPIGSTLYVLVSGSRTVSVPIRLANALAPTLPIDSTLYTSGMPVKAAVVSTDISPAFGQAFDTSGLTLSTAGNAINECTATARITCASGTTTRISLVLAPTRTRVAFTVDASGGIYTFPTACSATVERNGSSIVTVGQVATCTVACIGGSGLVPTGAKHGLVVPSGEATLWSVVAGGDVSPLPSSNGRLDYKVIPLVVPPGGVGTTALWTLGFAGLTSTYALSNVFTASTVYAVPTSLSVSVQFAGTSGITPDDGSITTLALGAAYGVDTSGSAISICGTGNTSHITMTLVGGDVGSIVKPTAVSSVQAVDASGVAYGTVGRFDYASPSSTVVVRSYTVATTLPASGTVSFTVVTRSPDGLTTTLTSSAMTVVVDATTVTLGTFATGLTLLSGASVLVPVTFGPVTPASAEVSSSGTFGALATSVTSGSFSATYAGAATATTFTFVVAPTRRRLTASVAATGILVWPASATTAPVSASKTVTIGVASAMTTTLSASVPTGAVTATLSALKAADSSSGATLGTPTVSGTAVSYTLTPTSNTTYTATLTLGAGTYSKAYTAQTLATSEQVYAWPTGVTALMALNGASSGPDYNVLGFAAGRTYSSAASPPSTITLTLTGIDTSPTNTAAVAATGAVRVYVGGTLVAGSVSAYTYESATNRVTVTSMTLDTTTGSLEFGVTVTAPSGAVMELKSSGHTVYAVPNTVSVSTIAGGDTYKLVASYETATKFTFSHTVSAIDSALGAFASGATTSALLTLATTPAITATLGTTLVASRVLGATVTATSATATMFTFTFVLTRTTATGTVASADIYTFPSVLSCSVVSDGPLGGTTVTLGQTCALTYTFTSAFPIGATHAVSATGATASLTTASPFTSRASSAVYSLVPTAKQAIVATVTVTFGGVSVPYAMTALASTAVYTMPTGLTATVSFSGSNAISAADSSLTTLAVGASYGTAAGSVVCGAGNTSSIVLALTGFDATTTNTTEIRTGSVSCVDAVATGTTYGTTPTYTYTAASHSASVGVYTLGATAPPSGSVRFAVVVTAPDGVPTTLRSAPYAVAVDATSATLGVVASGVTLISGSAVSVPVAFVGATPSGAEITATGGSFSALSSSVSAGSFSATYSGAASATTFTFVVTPTRRRIAVAVPSTSILVWPSSATTAPVNTITVGTASAMVTTLSSAVPAVVGATVTGVTAGASVSTPSVSGTSVTYTLTTTANATCTATVTLAVAGYSQSYPQTLATADQVVFPRAAVMKRGSNYIQLAEEISLSTYTVEFWIKSTDTVEERGILGRAGDRLGQNVRNGKLYTGNGRDSTATICDNKWHHCAVVFAHGNTQYIIDGKMDISGRFDNGTSMVPMYIGRSWTPGFTGALRDVRLWSVARTQAEIASNKDTPPPSNSSNLVFRFPLSGSTDDVVSNRAYTVTETFTYQPV